MASRRSEIRAERKALKEKEALQNASSGLKHKFTVVDALMYAFIAILSLICLYPFVNVIAYSLSGADAVLANDVTFYPKDFTLAAYKNIAARPTIWISLRVTIIITIAGTALGLVLTTAAAYALSRPNLPGRKVLSGLILFTMYFSGGIIPTFLVVKSLGMYDTLTALVIPNAMNVFNFVIMRTFFRQLPRELDEAAQIDGATEMQVLFRIVLTLSVPILATIGLFYAVQYWNDYFQSLLYIIDPNKFTLQLRLRSLLQTELNTDVSNPEGIGNQVMTQSLKMASVAIATIPIIIVYPWLQKYFVKGMMLGSVKG